MATAKLTHQQIFRAWKAWLTLQLGRQDAVGDFASDMLHDDCAKNVRTWVGLDRHLRDTHGLDTYNPAMIARDRAWKEWQEQQALTDKCVL